MAEHSGFFDAHLVDGNYDRVYLAEDFAKYFANFVGNGIFGGNANELVVYQQETATMSVRVLSGQAFINGYRYENDDELTLPVDVADGVQNRIDLIVVRFDNAERVIRLAVKKGTPATNPSAPTLQRNADYYELKLAEVYVRAGVTGILQTDIVDTRSDIDVCGFATTIADKDLAALNRKTVIIEKDTETIKTEIVNVKKDVEDVEKIIGFESSEYPGCYYRQLDNNEVEWLNPPMVLGVEYRTAERWEAKPVYVKRFYVAKMSNDTEMLVYVGVTGNKVISVTGFMINDKSSFHNFPLVRTNVVATTASLSSVNSTGYLTINVDADLTKYECYILVKYVKS